MGTAASGVDGRPPHLGEQFNAALWLVDRHVEAGDGGRVAIRSRGASYTYADLQGLVHRAGGALVDLGLRPEQRVLLVMLDSVEFVAAFLGAMRIGAVPVPVNPLLPGRDVAIIAADSRAGLAVVSGERAACIQALRAGAPEIHDVVVVGEPVGFDDDPTTLGSWTDLLASSSGCDPYATWPESPGFWLCTSGSTGQPKLAMHRHHDIRVTCETYARAVLDIAPDDRCFSVGPMFHAYGLGNSLTFPLSVGATTILEPTRPPTPDLVAEIMRTESPTLFFCIPTFYAVLNAADLPAETFACARWAVSAAEPLPAETFRRFRDRYGVTILDGIGSTELLHIYLSNNPASVKPGTSGVPVPGYDVRIVDDNGADQPVGEPGELIVRGDSMATGYWCRSAISRATFEGEWIHTGDLYVHDDAGFYIYMGRLDDMMRVGGEWVSPAEVEGVLIQHESVLEAAVVAERDDDGAVRPVAFIILQVDGSAMDIAALQALCKDRLAGYKRPRRYEVVTELPKTATGKIQRFRLRPA